MEICKLNQSRKRLSWWLRGKEPTCQCRRRGFNPWISKIPRRRKWQPSPVFLPAESHGQWSLVGYGPQGHRESDTTEQLNSKKPGEGREERRQSEGLAAASVGFLRWKAAGRRTGAGRQGQRGKPSARQGGVRPVSWDKVRGEASLSAAQGNAEAFRHFTMCVIWMTPREMALCAPWRRGSA